MLLFHLSLSQAEGKGEEGEERMRGEDGEAGTGGGSTGRVRLPVMLEGWNVVETEG
jgi:hypothetical protein